MLMKRCLIDHEILNLQGELQLTIYKQKNKA